MSDIGKQVASLVTVVGLSGSLRRGSRTREVVNAALAGAIALGAEARMLDLEDYDLPFCDGSLDPSHYGDGVLRLREDVRTAHGIVLGTPDYHGGVSGVLKNALDLMSASEFSGKVVGLVGVGGGAIGAFDALNCLRLTARSLHAWVVPEQAAVPHSDDAFDKDGRLLDERLAARLHSLGAQVAQFARLHAMANLSEFMQAWESTPPSDSVQTIEAL